MRLIFLTSKCLCKIWLLLTYSIVNFSRPYISFITHRDWSSKIYYLKKRFACCDAKYWDFFSNFNSSLQSKFSTTKFPKQACIYFTILHKTLHFLSGWTWGWTMNFFLNNVSISKNPPLLPPTSFVPRRTKVLYHVNLAQRPSPSLALDPFASDLGKFLHPVDRQPSPANSIRQYIGGYWHFEFDESGIQFIIQCFCTEIRKLTSPDLRGGGDISHFEKRWKTSLSCRSVNIIQYAYGVTDNTVTQFRRFGNRHG